jgi:hypothetical protein
MKQRLLVALLTVLVFGAGFAARMWTESDRPVPPPPAAVGAELTGGAQPEKKSPQNASKPYNRAQLIAEIEKLRPQIDEFRAKIDAIDAEYEKSFVGILNPDQRRVYDAKLEKKKAEHEKAASLPPPSPPPLSDEEIAKLRQRPFETIFWKVSTIMKLEQVTRDYKLDAAQQARERELLVARRDKVLALLDTTPPPTVRMLSLAPLVERLCDGSAPKDAKAPASGK